MLLVRMVNFDLKLTTPQELLHYLCLRGTNAAESTTGLGAADLVVLPPASGTIVPSVVAAGVTGGAVTGVVG